MKKGLLFIVSAPSGAGKTSLLEKLVSTNNDIVVAISHTTRASRPGEIHGENYFFITADAFKENIEKNNYLEYAEVYGNYYGTPKDTVSELLNSGKNVILEIDWQGARKVRESMPDAIGIFVLPPSVSALKQRLTGRAQDSDEVISKRLQAAQEDMSHFNEYHYNVINDDFNTAVEELKTIIEVEHLKPAQQQRKHRKMFAELVLPGGSSKTNH